MRAKAPWSRSKPENKRWLLLRLLKGFTNGFSTSARLVNVTVRSLITASTNAAAKRVLTWCQPRASFRMMLSSVVSGQSLLDLGVGQTHQTKARTGLSTFCHVQKPGAVPG